MFYRLKRFLILGAVFLLTPLPSPGFARETPLPGENKLGFDKPRIPALLKRENYELAEPFFFVSNRPTIGEALAEAIRENTLIAPENHMIYCPAQKDYISGGALGPGSVYIDVPNLPKNGDRTRRWFRKAYDFQTGADRADVADNVVIIAGRRRPFLRVRCPMRRHNVILAYAGARSETPPRQVIESVKTLGYPTGEQAFETADYNLPSTLGLQYQQDKEKRDLMAGKNALRQKKLLEVADYMVRAARPAALEEGAFIKVPLAMAQVLSGFAVDKVGARGEVGVMQVPREVAAAYNLKAINLIDPKVNFAIGLKHFARLMTRFNNDFAKALAAYKVGEKRIAELNTPKLPPEADLFIRQVKSYLDPKQPIFY